MDLLIKGMEMPSCCGNCQFNQFHEANPWTTWETCRILDKNTDDIGEGRLADCPLVALPEHGELISRGGALFQLQAEALGISPNDKDFEGIKKGLLIARKIIIEAPVIVEASNE